MTVLTKDVNQEVHGYPGYRRAEKNSLHKICTCTAVCCGYNQEVEIKGYEIVEDSIVSW